MAAERGTAPVAEAAMAIVAAMGTDAWTSTRERAAAVFLLVDPGDFDTGLRRQLDAHAAVVARSADSDRARALLIGAWVAQLEALVARHPHAAARLSGLTDAAVPSVERRFQQDNTAHDHGVVNAVQHGTQHNHYMDSGRPRPAAALAPEDPDL